MRRKHLFLFIFMLVTTLMLAACSGDGGVKEESEEESSGEMAEEQVLVYARGGDSTSLDFASVSDGESSRVTKNIFDSLLEYEDDSFEVKEGLAKDWEVSDDGLTYTFYLKEDVTFHDGTEFNADAVKVNYERWSDPDHEYAFKDEGYTYGEYGSMFGGFKGDDGHVIEEINVIDDYEIEFILNRPQGSFLQNVAMHYFAITSPEALEEYGDDINENPVGTGPFKFVSWSKDDKIVLEKFDDYREEGFPKLDKVIYEVIPETSARLVALRSGDVDLIDEVSPDDAESIEADEELELHTRNENNVGFLGMNSDKAPLDDKTVRQAINYAVDKEAMVEALYSGYASPGVSLIPPSYMGHNDEIEDYPYDVERAEELLEEAGYEDGLELDLWVMPVSRPYMPNPETVAEILESDLGKIGIEVNIVREEWAPYLEKTSEGDQELFLLGWSGSNGDPDYFYSSLVHSNQIGGENRSFYENEEVDKLIDEAATTVDEDERESLYKEIQEILHEETPQVNLVHSKPLVAASSKVKDFIAHPSTSDPLYKVYIEE